MAIQVVLMVAYIMHIKYVFCLLEKCFQIPRKDSQYSAEQQHLVIFVEVELYVEFFGYVFCVIIFHLLNGKI